MKDCIARSTAGSSILLDTHRHRSLTGDSKVKNGTVVFAKLSKLDCLLAKYLLTTSASDKNQNLTPTKFQTWKHIDGKYSHSGVSIISDIYFKSDKL